MREERAGEERRRKLGGGGTGEGEGGGERGGLRKNIIVRFDLIHFLGGNVVLTSPLQASAHLANAKEGVVVGVGDG